LLATLGRDAATAFCVPRRADDAEMSVFGCPSRFASADEPNNEAFARRQLAHQSARLMNRDASVDSSGYVRGDVPAADELARFF
jgi:hypothetical protein